MFECTFQYNIGIVTIQFPLKDFVKNYVRTQTQKEEDINVKIPGGITVYYFSPSFYKTDIYILRQCILQFYYSFEMYVKCFFFFSQKF